MKHDIVLWIVGIATDNIGATFVAADFDPGNRAGKAPRSISSTQSSLFFTIILKTDSVDLIGLSVWEVEDIYFAAIKLRHSVVFFDFFVLFQSILLLWPSLTGVFLTFSIVLHSFLFSSPLSSSLGYTSQDFSHCFTSY